MQIHSVLLVEDQDHTRERLSQVIAGHPQLELLGAVATCADARRSLTEQAPKVLLTDIGLPDGNGIELIRETQSQHPDTEIMVITVFGDEQHVIGAIEAGASGYLLKDGSPEYIGQAIMQMLSGGSPISPSIARYLLKRFQVSAPVAEEPVAETKTKTETKTEPAQELPRLTEREQEVLRLIAKGFSYNEIAGMLHLSVHTVTSHIKQIYRKLAVRSRGEAVYEAMQLGLLQIDN